MAKDDLVGNIPSEGAFQWLSLQGKTQLQSKLDWAQLKLQAIEVNAGIIK
jgi:hypothetical protein